MAVVLVGGVVNSGFHVGLVHWGSLHSSPVQPILLQCAIYILNSNINLIILDQLLQEGMYHHTILYNQNIKHEPWFEPVS